MTGIVSMACLAFFFLGVDLLIPGVGRVVISQTVIIVPYIGKFAIAFNDVTPAMLDTLFLMINWNLLWYLAAPLLLLVLIKPRLIQLNRTVFLALLCSVFFVLFVYYFTPRYKFALDYTQVNRALIYIAPLSVFLIAALLNSMKTVNSDTENAKLELNRLPGDEFS